jgi:phenylacetate-CoA ligase
VDVCEKSDPTAASVRADQLDAWQWSEQELAGWQIARFNEQLAAILPANEFYRRKFAGLPHTIQTLDDLQQFPLTTKEELIDSQRELGLSGHHTYPRSSYCRVHRTSGTRGAPLLVMDCQADWEWWAATWQHVLAAGGIGAGDRVFMAFSFGPFVGFWSAYEACSRRGAMIIPGGGLSSLGRLEFMRQVSPTVIACTPTYALQLAEVAARSGHDLREFGVRRILVAGEPGGSVPPVRQRIENAWNAAVIDHCGATEIGPWGMGWPGGIGLHIIETSFIAEFLPPTNPAARDDLRELVLTSLGRLGAPVIRYRTGDLVRAVRPPSGPCRFLWLPEGIVGRADDMVIIRGVNVFPSSIDALVRAETATDEYRVLVSRRGELDELSVEVEASQEVAARIARRCELQLGLRIAVAPVAAESLPRSDGKSRRWFDQRTSRT